MRTSITIFRDLILWLCPQIQLSFLVVSVPDLNQPQGVGLGLRPRFRSEIKTTVGLGLGLRITSEMQVFRNKGNLEHLLICLCQVFSWLEWLLDTPNSWTHQGTTKQLSVRVVMSVSNYPRVLHFTSGVPFNSECAALQQWYPVLS